MTKELTAVNILIVICIIITAFIIGLGINIVNCNVTLSNLENKNICDNEQEYIKQCMMKKNDIVYCEDRLNKLKEIYGCDKNAKT